MSGLPTSVQTEQPTTTVPIEASLAPCDGDPGVGGAAPDGAAAGDLIAAEELHASSADADGFPTEALVWRILYVSTGVDEDDLQLVCGLAAAPADGPSDDGGTGRMLARAHGTIGLQQACLPSVQPETSFWGPMGAGIGAVAWGTGFRARKGDAADGALQTALDRGWVVSAADYQPNDTYIMGRIAAANVIDAARATTQLMDQHFGAATTPDTYDTIAVGPLPGWPRSPVDRSALRRVPAGCAEPAQRHADARRHRGRGTGDQPDRPARPPARGRVRRRTRGLGDAQVDPADRTADPRARAADRPGAVLVTSSVRGRSSPRSRRPHPTPRCPPIPAEHADLDLDAVATAQGATTIAQVQPLCLNKADSSRIKGIVVAVPRRRDQPDAGAVAVERAR